MRQKKIATSLAVLAALAALAAAMLLGGCTTKVVTASGSGPQAGTVTAQGSGTASAIPDQAVMSFGVSAQAKDAKSALDQVSAKADKVDAAIKADGVADKDIQTQNVSVDPQYGNVPSGSSRPAPIIGYQASLSVSAKVRDLGSLSKVIDDATKAGLDNVNGPTFSISEDSSYREVAIAKAVADARITAAAMAKAAGKSLGAVLSVTSNTVNSPIGLAYSGHRIGAASAAVPIQPGQLDVSADLTVVFELK
jgi:uncharacterized protein YggE